MSNPSVSVVIPTFGRPASLVNCLASLKNQRDNEFEIIVVYGGESDSLEALASEWGQHFPLRLIPEGGDGLASARNVGWQSARAPIVAFIDDDVVAEPSWMNAVVQTFASSLLIGGVSGPTVIPVDRLMNRDVIAFQQRSGTSNPLLRTLRRIYLDFVLEGQTHTVGKILKSGAFTPGSNYEECLALPAPVEVDYAEACNMSFRRDLIERAGGFDESYAGTGDWSEPDLAFKIRQRGYRLIFNPQAIVHHHVSQTGVYQARTHAYERSRNFVQFYFRWVKPNVPDKFFRFLLHLAFINSYWVYKFAITKNVNWLSGLWGTLSGLVSVVR